jgi:hypothetical protein
VYVGMERAYSDRVIGVGNAAGQASVLGGAGA